MNNIRKYGEPPYIVAVIHGGPGAPGDVAPIARELSLTYGVLEPLQTQATLSGQIEELASLIQDNADIPITLIGHSWGAMLSYIVTAQNPILIKKLILVSSGVFDEKYASSIMDVRLSRLTNNERKAFDSMLVEFNSPAIADKNAVFEKFGKLMEQADSYDLLPHDNDIIEYQYKIFDHVWPEARELRASGELLALGKQIKCPVVAIHGDHDPHPRAGIETPLANVLSDFRFISLDKCGHYPWHEKHARTTFFDILRQELKQ
ncbi:MAG: alpha/beta hydrolase [Chloroflexi bacterium]|jgi:pimeloyl-ACP methyl ester carboxylesterase|nr:alpha/beta hydrolase [Chloroflexota bacterium]MBT7080079.1 alpha/beta hydrolase [Chloroflexota bacterium]MBT7290469.1 alpha/beta hydrolase [Chloroflexota bacterium]